MERKRIKGSILLGAYDTSAYLFEEPQNLLKQELREPAIYNSIITAIANSLLAVWTVCVDSLCGILRLF